MGKLLKKEDLTRFLYKLRQRGDLIAPVKTNTTRFEKINDIKKISLEDIPQFSPKKFFVPQKETILKYDDNKISHKKIMGEKIIFGIRLCDINALHRMDKVFIEGDNPDTYYKKRRENTILIGYNCEKPLKTCFCESMNLEPVYDLFFYNMGNYYYIEVGSEKGSKLVSRLKDYEYDPVQIRCEKKLNKKLLLRHHQKNVWSKLTKDCVSCGKCNTMCPSCYCFTIRDENDETLRRGERVKEWDSCQYKDFTQVAGGFVFRETRKDRLRHRIYHKLLYFRQKYQKDMCVGCGRCITYCPSKIDFVEAINKLR
ncbi:4Fe-4S binding protein [Candidatus Woesearchaeota archaeon]|nr:4Fe-4S binding protein [Candidatus Woesearchaeota archaeon]